MAVWEVIMLARRYDFDAERMTEHYPVPVETFKAAFTFYEAYREEIDQAIEDNDIGYENLKRLLPNIRLFEVASAEQKP